MPFPVRKIGKIDLVPTGDLENLPPRGKALSGFAFADLGFNAELQ